jgi:signal transduction histidine kinase
MHAPGARFSDIRARSREFWQSVQLTPRANNALLAVFACLRVLAIVAITFRLERWHPIDSPWALFATAENIFLAGALVYALFMLGAMLWDRQFFFSQELKLVQVIGDVLVYSGAFYFAQDVHSDIYFLNVMPLLMAIEYFPFAFAILILFFTSTLHVMVIFWLPPPGGVVDWIMRDLLPRTFIIGLMGLAYLVHRRLRLPSDATLESERTQMMDELHRISEQLPSSAQATADAFEYDLQTYLDKIDWYRRMLTREANGRMEHLSRDLFSVGQTFSPDLLIDPLRQRAAVRSVIEQLARAVDCCAATLRVEEATKDGAAVLALYHATGCAAGALEQDPTFSRLLLNDETLVVEAHRSDLVQKWVAKSRTARPPLRNAAFLTQCRPQAAIAIPTMVGAQRGVASFYRNLPREFTAVEQSFLLSVLDYMSISLAAGLEVQNATRLSKRREQQLALVREFADLLPSQGAEDAMLRYVAVRLREAFGAEATSVLLLQGEELRRAVDAGLPEGWFPEEHYLPGQSITGEAFEDASPFVLENRAFASDRIPLDYRARYETVLPSHQVRHILAARLQTKSRTIGVLRLVNRLQDDGRPHESGFDGEEATLLVTLAALVAMALESHRRLNRQEVLVKLAHNSNRRVLAPQRVAPDYVKGVAEEICAAACKALNTQQAGVVLFESEDGGTDEGVIVAQVQKALTVNGDLEYRPLNTLQFPWIDLRHVPAMATLQRALKPVAIADAQASEAVDGLRGLYALQGVASTLLAPLVVNGEMIGLLSIEALQQKRQFAADDVEVANLIAALGAPAIATARKLADERRVSREEERVRIRHDLHNLRGIMNSTIVVDLQLMEDMLHRGELGALAKEFRVVRSQLSFMHNQFGILMLDLHDPVLYEEGLVAAIDNYIAQSANLLRRVSFATEGAERVRLLSLQVQHVVYRIAQEAITNACHHGIGDAPDGHVDVRLVCRDSVLELEVKDNGRGFDKHQPPHGSLGLNIMRQWAADMRYHADLEIDSAVGEGTRVHLCVDLSQAQFEDAGD